jgi:hypothetical protein
MQVLKAAFCSLIYELDASFLASMACKSVDQGTFSYKNVLSVNIFMQM